MTRAAVGKDNLAEQPLVLLVQVSDILVAELVETALVRGGYEVHRATSAEGAIAALAQPRPFAGLVVDVDLLGPTSGWEIAHHARRLYPQIVVIYTSGGSTEEYQTRRVQASGLIPKPVVPDQITTGLSALLNVRALKLD